MSAARIMHFFKLATIATVNAGIIATATRKSIQEHPPFTPPSEEMNTTGNDVPPRHDESPQSIRNRY